MALRKGKKKVFCLCFCLLSQSVRLYCTCVFMCFVHLSICDLFYTCMCLFLCLSLCVCGLKLLLLAVCVFACALVCVCVFVHEPWAPVRSGKHDGEWQLDLWQGYKQNDYCYRVCVRAWEGKKTPMREKEKGGQKGKMVERKRWRWRWQGGKGCNEERDKLSNRAKKAVWDRRGRQWCQHDWEERKITRKRVRKGLIGILRGPRCLFAYWLIFKLLLAWKSVLQGEHQ